MSKKYYILILVIILGVILRLYKIGEVPPSPDWDEVSLGYNAYSILQTGRDEYGEFLPIVLRSFDDYKPALYTYLIIPFIKILGLNVIAVRLPSVVFGVIAVITTYLLVNELFKRSNIALLTSFLVSISPWHIQFSRIAFESNVGLSLNLLVTLFFIKGLKNPKLLPISFILGALNLHMYQSNRVFTPLLLLVLSIIFKKEIWKNIKWYGISIFLAFILAIPLLFYILSNQNALLRAKGVSVFSDQTEFLKRNTNKLENDLKNNDYLGMVIDNRRFEYAKSIVSGYISHFNLNWLFISGDIARHHAPNMGLLYLIELPFIFIGIYGLLFGQYEKRTKLTVFAIFLLAPIPASITKDVPHAVRALNFLPTLQVFVALGIIQTFQFVSNIKYQPRFNRGQALNIKIKYLIFFMYISFFIFNILYYLNQYFVQYPIENSMDWQYGYKEAVSEVEKIEPMYEKIVVSNMPHLDQSYMFFLFYLKYPPNLYQTDAKNASGGFRENHIFGKFEFRPIEWNKEIRGRSVLYVGKSSDFLEDARNIKTIRFLNNETAIKIVEK